MQGFPKHLHFLSLSNCPSSQIWKKKAQFPFLASSLFPAELPSVSHQALVSTPPPPSLFWSRAPVLQPCQRTPRWPSGSTAVSRSLSLWLTCCPSSTPWTIRAVRWAWAWVLALLLQERLCYPPLTQTLRTADRPGTTSWSTFWPKWASLWVWVTSGDFPTCARRTVEVGAHVSVRVLMHFNCWESCNTFRV